MNDSYCGVDDKLEIFSCPPIKLITDSSSAIPVHDLPGAFRRKITLTHAGFWSHTLRNIWIGGKHSLFLIEGESIVINVPSAEDSWSNSYQSITVELDITRVPLRNTLSNSNYINISCLSDGSTREVCSPESRIYYTDACGNNDGKMYYGSGKDCQECPYGAECPGIHYV